MTNESLPKTNTNRMSMKWTVEKIGCTWKARITIFDGQPCQGNVTNGTFGNILFQIINDPYNHFILSYLNDELQLFKDREDPTVVYVILKNKLQEGLLKDFHLNNAISLAGRLYNALPDKI